MKELTSPFWIKPKEFLFLGACISSSALLVMEHPTLKTVVLLVIAIGFFCRFYYFAFYVIEHYLDPGYRYSGLWSFARAMLSRRDRAGG